MHAVVPHTLGARVYPPTVHYLLRTKIPVWVQYYGREPSRQELSSCGENSTNESKVTLFGTVMYLSFEGSDQGGGVLIFWGEGS